MFRNRPEYRFEGRLHEQCAQHLPGYLPERLEITDVRVDHFGYLGVVRDEKAKSARNIELLERQIAEGDDSPFLHFNLGSEHARRRRAARRAATSSAARGRRVRGDPRHRARSASCRRSPAASSARCA